MGGVGRPMMTLDAADVGLVMSGVAGGAVGACGAEREAAGVTGGTLDAVVSRVVEWKQPARPVERAYGDVQGAWHAGIQGLHIGGGVAAGAVGGQGLSMVAGAAVTEARDERSAVRALAAVALLTIDLGVLGMTEGQVQRRRPTGKRVALEAPRLGHPDARPVARHAIVAAPGNLHLVGIVAAHAVAQHSGSETPMIRREQLRPVVAPGATARGPYVTGPRLRDHVVTRRTHGAMRLQLGHGLVQAVVGRQATQVHPHPDAPLNRNRVRRRPGESGAASPLRGARMIHPHQQTQPGHHPQDQLYPTAPGARARAFLSSEHV